MDSNELNPWTVKQFNLVWLEIIQWFGVVWIINVEGWIGLGGLDLYGGNGLVGFRMGFWPICRLTSSHQRAGAAFAEGQRRRAARRLPAASGGVTSQEPAGQAARSPNAHQGSRAGCLVRVVKKFGESFCIFDH